MFMPVNAVQHAICRCAAAAVANTGMSTADVCQCSVCSHPLPVIVCKNWMFFYVTLTVDVLSVEYVWANF